MNNIKLSQIFIFTFLLMALTGCEFIGAVFEAGVWVGVFIVVFVLFLIILLIRNLL